MSNLTPEEYNAFLFKNSCVTSLIQARRDRERINSCHKAFQLGIDDYLAGYPSNDEQDDALGYEADYLEGYEWATEQADIDSRQAWSKALNR